MKTSKAAIKLFEGLVGRLITSSSDPVSGPSAAESISLSSDDSLASSDDSSLEPELLLTDKVLLYFPAFRPVCIVGMTLRFALVRAVLGERGAMMNLMIERALET